MAKKTILKKVYCSDCDKNYTKIYVISEATQERDLETGDFEMVHIGNTLRTECEGGHILSEGDL